MGPQRLPWKLEISSQKFPRSADAIERAFQGANLYVQNSLQFYPVSGFGILPYSACGSLRRCALWCGHLGFRPWCNYWKGERCKAARVTSRCEPENTEAESRGAS